MTAQILSYYLLLLFFPNDKLFLGNYFYNIKINNNLLIYFFNRNYKYYISFYLFFYEIKVNNTYILLLY